MEIGYSYCAHLLARSFIHFVDSCQCLLKMWFRPMRNQCKTIIKTLRHRHVWGNEIPIPETKAIEVRELD